MPRRQKRRRKKRERWAQGNFSLKLAHYSNPLFSHFLPIIQVSHVIIHTIMTAVRVEQEESFIVTI